MMFIASFIVVSCKEDDPRADVNPLTAKAGTDIEATVGSTVTLDGSASSNAEGESFAYSWNIKTKPTNSQASLNGSNTPNPELVPDKTGYYVIELVISKDHWTSKDEVTVSVSDESELVIKISEDITSDLVLEDIFTDDWTKIDYLVTKPIKLYARLTINPKVKVAFAEDASLTIEGSGTFISEGGEQEEDRIYLVGSTSNPGFWAGLRFKSGESSNKMVYTSVSDAGSETDQQNFYAAVWMEDNSALRVDNSFFVDNSGLGLYVSADASLISFAGNYFKGTQNNMFNVALPAVEVVKISGDNQMQNGGVAVTTDDLSGDEVVEWNPYDYTLLEGLSIGDNFGLKLRVGTSLFVEEDKQIALMNGGFMDSEGIVNNPVRIKGLLDVEGYWKGIYIVNSQDNPSVLKHTLISGAGSSPHAGNQSASVHLGQNGKAAIDFSSLILGAGDGVEATSEGASLISFNDNAIRYHMGYPIAVSTTNVSVIDKSTYFVNNAINKVRIDGNYPIASDQETIWEGFDQDYMSYHVKGLGKDLTIWSGLKLKAGVILEMENEARIVVENANGRLGYLNAAGTNDKHVVFKNIDNLPGSWYGITFSTIHDNNRLEYSEVLHGGKPVQNSFSANIVIDNSPEGRATIFNSLIGFSGQHGVSVLDDKRSNLADANLSFIEIPESEIYAW